MAMNRRSAITCTSPHRLVMVAAALLALAGCGHGGPPAVAPQAIVAAPDRTEADRKLDAGRKPVEFLRFLAVTPGMKVAELFAGGGYTTELLARAVGPSGVVYGQNTPFVLQRFAEKPWSERLKRPVNARVVRVDRELDDPLPPEARDLDLVVSNIIYHDTVWQGVDRAKMNAAIHAALKPGGRYVICDSSAKEGSGAAAAKTLHRIDEALVRSEVTAAGFQLVATADFLRNPQDTRDWNSSPMAAGERRGTSDRFCLAFRKP
jgi:predicted methyltransferase